jgi:hypothetical protein
MGWAGAKPFLAKRLETIAGVWVVLFYIVIPA